MYNGQKNMYIKNEFINDYIDKLVIKHILTTVLIVIWAVYREINTITITITVICTITCLIFVLRMILRKNRINTREKSDLSIKENGEMYVCENIVVNQNYGAKVSGFYSFYITCNYLDSGNNAINIESDVFILRKDKIGMRYNNGELDVKCEAVVYVDKVNEDRYYVEVSATALR